MKKKVTLAIDSKAYNEFKNYCKINAIMLSKRIEIFMKEFVKGKKALMIFSLMFAILLMQFSSAVSIFSDDFESGGLASWNLSTIENNWTVETTDPFEGNLHAQANPRNTNEPASVMQLNKSTSGFQNINFSYYRKLIGLDAADEFQVEWFNGTNWSILEQTGASSANDPSYVHQSFLLPSIADNNIDFQIKFECTAGAVSEYCRVDNVTITGDAVAGDSEYPIFSSFLENPTNGTTYSSGMRYEFNTTLTSTNGTVGIEFNSVNYTTSNLSNSEFNFSILDLGVGVYSYYFWGFGNGSSANYNSSSIRYYSVLQATGNISLYLNNTEGNISIQQGTNLDINSSLILGNGDIEVFVNGSLIFNGTGPSYNSTNFTQAGLINVTSIYLGNNNYSSDYNTFWVNVSSVIVDIMAPNVTNLVENPVNGSSYVQNGKYEFNVTIVDDGAIDSVLFEFNGINYSASNISNNYNVSLFDLSAGTYSYKWYVNDTSGNINNSGVGDYSILNATGDVNLLLNGIIGDLSVQYPQQVNLSANTSYGSVTIYRDGVDVTSENGVNVTLGVEYYNITAVSSGNQNYSSAKKTYWLNVTQGTPTLNYYLNGISENSTVQYPQQVNATGTTDFGVLSLFRDGNSIVNGQNYSLSVGYYRFDYNVTGNQNYTNTSQTLFSNVTQSSQSITPLLNGVNSNLVINYSMQINSSFSGANQTTVSIEINGTSVSIGQNYTWGVGFWSVNYSALGNQNYSEYSGFLNLTINQISSEVNLTLNGTEGNISITAGETIMLNGTLITGDSGNFIQLYNNGSLINSNSLEVSNLTNFTQTGEYNITVIYVSSQNYSQSSETYWVNVTQNLDIVVPNVTNLQEPVNPSIYSQGANYQFNATVVDDVGIESVILQFNGTNYISQNLVSSVYNVTLVDLGVGTYNYLWIANDTSGNVNNSEAGSFVVNQAIGDANLLLNSSAGNQTGIYGIQTNASTNTSYGSVTLYRDGVDVTSENNIFVTLGVGNYNYTSVSSGNQNYSSVSLTRWVHITQTTGNISLYLNNTEGNISIQQGTNLDINSSLISGNGNIEIYVNNSLIFNGSSPSYNSTNFTQIGLINVTSIYLGNNNYSSDYNTFWVNVSTGTSQVSNSAPVVNLNNTIVNNSVKTPVFGDIFFIQTNISDPENDTIIFANFTVLSPNGSNVVNNIIGTNYLESNFSIWNSTSYTVNDYGYWNWSYVLSDGNNSVSENGNFRVLSDLSVFPLGYKVAPDPKNQTLFWNISMYHKSAENYTYDFSYDLNSTFFNVTFQNNQSTIGNGIYNDSNLYKNQVTITITDSVLDSTIYYGNITITRSLDGINNTIPIVMGVNPPSGNIDAFNIGSGEKCSGSNCYNSVQIENDESTSLSWRLNNTGNYTLTDCSPSVSGFNISSFGSFSSESFNLTIGENKDLELILTNPPINSYYGRLEVICKATQLDYEDSLGAEGDNSPSFKILVTADSGSSNPPGPSPNGNPGGGGGSTTGSSIGAISKFEMTIGDLEILNLKRGESEFVELEILNTGNKFLNNCKLFATGLITDWISNSQSESLSPGQKIDFIFGLNVPIDAKIKNYESFIRIDCDEFSESKEIKLNVVSGDFEIFILNSERIPGNKLRVEYSLENLIESDLSLEINYKLKTDINIIVVEGSVNELIEGNSKKNLGLEFDLPKNSIGDFILILEAVRDIEKSSAEQKLRLSPDSLTGFAISDENLRILTWIGIIFVLGLFLLLTIKFLKKHHKKHHHERGRNFIKIDLKD